jgi:hypothetical protein
MDAINNQLGAAERQWTKDVNDHYNLNYVDNCGNDDDDDNGRGGSFKMAAGERTTKIATPRQSLHCCRRQSQ